MTSYPELTVIRLKREIAQLGYGGGYTTAKDFVRRIRPSSERGYEHRFETPAGKQGQVDFAQFKVRFTESPGEEHRVKSRSSCTASTTRELRMSGQFSLKVTPRTSTHAPCTRRPLWLKS